MKQLRQRLERLEAIRGVEAEGYFYDRTYTLTREERQTVVSCLRSESPLPPDIVEKLNSTPAIKRTSRLYGMTKEEREEAMRQLLGHGR